MCQLESQKNLINKSFTELTEVEALRTIVHQNDFAINVQNSIKGWVTFFGIMYILTIVGFIFINITS